MKIDFIWGVTEIKFDGKPLKLSRPLTRMGVAVIKARGEIVSYGELRRLGGMPFRVSEYESVRSQMSNLRKELKFHKKDAFLVNVTNRGYKWIEPSKIEETQ